MPSTQIEPSSSGNDLRQRQPGAHRRRADQVVAAAVAQPGQGVVLSQNRHPRPRRALPAELGFEGGGHARGAHLHGYARGLQQSRQPLGGLDLLVADLGVGVNPVGGLDQFGGPALDRFTNALLELLHVVCHHRQG